MVASSPREFWRVELHCYLGLGRIQSAPLVGSPLLQTPNELPNAPRNSFLGAFCIFSSKFNSDDKWRNRINGNFTYVF